LTPGASAPNLRAKLFHKAPAKDARETRHAAALLADYRRSIVSQ
jgi:hypothetical protein